VSGVASCRCAALPAWPSQLVQQGLSGSPRFRAPPSARATLSDPGKPSTPSPGTGVSVLGSGMMTPSPLAARSFEAELLKQDAGPACGSRVSLGTLLDGRSTRWNHKSTGSPPAKQPSVLGCWLDFSIHHFRSELQRLGLQTWGTSTPGFARLLRAHHHSSFNLLHSPQGTLDKPWTCPGTIEPSQTPVFDQPHLSRPYYPALRRLRSARAYGVLPATPR